MRRAALVLLVALLLVPAVAIAADGQTARPSAATPHEAGIAVLTLDPPQNAQLLNRSVDLSGALSVERAGAGARLDRYAFETRLDTADETGDIVTEAERTVEERSLAVHDEERARWARFANGSIGATAFVRGLAETEVRTAELNRWVTRIGQERGDSTPQVQDRILTALDGPVRSDLAGVIRGSDTAPIFVAAADHGIVLATLSDGQYVREAYRPDRMGEEREQIDPSRAIDLNPALLERYGLSDVSRWGTQELGGGTFYQYSYEFGEGTIDAYLDGGTEQIFYEEQTRDLARFSGGPAVVGVENGTRLVVNRTFPGGPLRIATYDDITGIPVSSTIEVDGRRIETGDDHVAWTLMPAEERISVTAVRSGDPVTVSVAPHDPNGIDDP